MSKLPVVGLMLWVVANVGAVDLAFNGGFESGFEDDADGWEEGVIGEGTTLVREAGAGVAGSVAMVGMVDYVSGTGTKTELRQRTVAGSVVPGEDYALSFQAKGLMGVGGVAWYELFWFNRSGAPVGGSGLGNLFADLTEEYEQFGGVFTAPAGADSVEVSIRLEGGAFDGSSGELYVDDVVLEGESVDGPGGSGELNLQIERNGAALVFSWDSRAGKVYDLRSSETLAGDPRGWPIVFGDIEATPGTNVESVGFLADTDEFFVLVERER